MKKNKRKFKLFMGIMLSMVLCISITGESYAYYCTSECYQVCGQTMYAGQCSLDMSCPSACTGHHAASCWIVFAEATCTKNGKIQTQICDAVSQLGICHERDEFIYPAALGHDYCSWYKISDTEHERYCKRHCGESGDWQTEGHTYDPKYPIAYKDNGDTQSVHFNKV